MRATAQTPAARARCGGRRPRPAGTICRTSGSPVVLHQRQEDRRGDEDDQGLVGDRHLLAAASRLLPGRARADGRPPRRARLALGLIRPTFPGRTSAGVIWRSGTARPSRARLAGRAAWVNCPFLAPPRRRATIRTGATRGPRRSSGTFVGPVAARRGAARSGRLRECRGRGGDVPRHGRRRPRRGRRRPGDAADAPADHPRTAALTPTRMRPAKPKSTSSRTPTRRWHRPGRRTRELRPLPGRRLPDG